MTDEELTAIVQAVKTVLTERDTSQRTEVEMLRQDLATLNARLQAHREASAESQQRMVHLLRSLRVTIETRLTLAIYLMLLSM